MGRPTSRIQTLAEVHGRLREVVDSLQAIDLRQTRGTLRDELRYTRESAQNALDGLEAAIQADAPAKAS